MEIIKYKYIKNGRYELTIDDQKVVLYEDLIIKNNILSQKNINQDLLNKYIKENEYYEKLNLVLKYIKTRIRSEKEINDFLKTKVDKKTNSNIIKTLKDKNLIDDDRFTIAFINDQIKFTNNGPYKIIKELEKHGIKKSIIDKNIKVFDNDIKKEKIQKIINQKLKLYKNKSYNTIKYNISNNLIMLGYSDFNDYIDDIKIDDSTARKNEYEKIYKKLSNKYKGKELELKIKQKMYQKGFNINNYE